MWTRDRKKLCLHDKCWKRIEILSLYKVLIYAMLCLSTNLCGVYMCVCVIKIWLYLKLTPAFVQGLKIIIILKIVGFFVWFEEVVFFLSSVVRHELFLTLFRRKKNIFLFVWMKEIRVSCTTQNVILKLIGMSTLNKTSNECVLPECILYMLKWIIHGNRETAQTLFIHFSSRPLAIIDPMVCSTFFSKNAVNGTHA